mgnify:CR=1 FL=1
MYSEYDSPSIHGIWIKGERVGGVISIYKICCRVSDSTLYV